MPRHFPVSESRREARGDGVPLGSSEVLRLRGLNLNWEEPALRGYRPCSSRPFPESAVMLRESSMVLSSFHRRAEVTFGVA